VSARADIGDDDGKCVLERGFSISKPTNVFNQAADFRARKLLTKCRHTAFAVTHD